MSDAIAKRSVKIYIDTNWFLSFYQSSHERQDILAKPMTEQNRTEFRRNRSALLRSLHTNVEKTAWCGLGTVDQPSSEFEFDTDDGPIPIH